MLDVQVKRSIFFVTGTDTDVGKSVLASLLTRHWRASGVPVAALKPLCSGNRRDAELLRAAQAKALTLNEINPWHFGASLAPLIAARNEHRKVVLSQVADHVVHIQKRFPCIIVEGAGGLLSPLGENFDSRDLIEKLGAIPIVVCPNRLGAINQVRLVLAALPKRFSNRARIVLMSEQHPDSSSTTNPELLGEILRPRRIHVFPRTKWRRRTLDRKARAAVESLATDLFISS